SKQASQFAGGWQTLAAGQFSRPYLDRKLLVELAVKRDFGFVNQRWRKIHPPIPYHIGLAARRLEGVTIRFKAMRGFALVALTCGVALVAWPAQKKKKDEVTQTLQLPKELP